MLTLIQIVERWVFYSVKDILRCLMAKIKMISNKNQTGRILTNGNIACALVSINDFVYVPIENMQGQAPHYFGNILGVRLFVDPYMKWGDNRILFYGVDDNLIHTLNVIDNNTILI